MWKLTLEIKPPNGMDMIKVSIERSKISELIRDIKIWLEELGPY